jgi:putative spermidine/putrescine transport system substrate-binding protein
MSTRNRNVRARAGNSRRRTLASIPALTAMALAVCAAAFSIAASASAPRIRAHASSASWSSATSAAAGGGMTALVTAAKAEKTLNVIALPSDWANYGAEITTFEKKYGIKINSEAPSDSSAQEIEAIKSSRGRSSAPDVVDVGQAYATASTSLFAPYEVATWAQIPAAQKDANGDWYNDYGGYVSFGCNLKIVKTCPTTWAQLASPQYKGDVALNGSPVSANAALSAVWAASLNNGGSLSNITPGITFFKKLESDGNFNSTDCNAASLIEAGQCPIVINWDYLNTSGAWGLASSTQWKVVDPTGTPFAAYYDQAVSKNAPHPAAARLWEEFLYSTTGQNLWLEGGARPVELPSMVKAGTENKAAYAKLPAVKTPVKAFPTAAQSTAAATTISSNWTS